LVIEHEQTGVGSSDAAIELITNSNDSDAYLMMNTNQGSSRYAFIGVDESAGAAYLKWDDSSSDFSAADVAAYWEDDDFAANISHHAGVNGGRLELSGSDLVLRTFRGASPSVTQPVFVEIPNNDSGSGSRFQITSTANMDIDISEVTGSFGTTAGTAWDNDMPFYVYLINSNGSASGLRLAISRNPVLSRTPSTNDLAYEGNASTNDNENTVFYSSSSNENSTVADKPMIRIGGVRMTKNSSNVWTISTFNWENGSGLRDDPFLGQKFTMPEDQNGAENGTHLNSSTSSTPTWATPANILYEYTVNPDTGDINIVYTTGAAGNCTNGTDAGSIRLALPCGVSNSYATNTPFKSSIISVGGARVNIACRLDGGSNSQRMNLRTSEADTANLKANDFSDISDDLYFDITYRTMFTD
jgi:hypothetical protein